MQKSEDRSPPKLYIIINKIAQLLAPGLVDKSFLLPQVEPVVEQKPSAAWDGRFQEVKNHMSHQDRKEEMMKPPVFAVFAQILSKYINTARTTQKLVPAPPLYLCRINTSA